MVLFKIAIIKHVLVFFRDDDARTHLRLLDLKFLNDNMEKFWLDWVNDAPEEWKKDGFITEHAPIAVTSRFGQDQPICSSINRVTESLSWLNERCYQKIRFVSIGLATHVR